ncbi:ribosome biogenesis GTPase Der [Alkalilimnicola ehrlichii]|uniref:GTPase Der n=1 Tax=Alkalilimnicola ehrlichii TaxID=351052 RepID=A0A3E0WZ04_9GAMM|nr:ribosome biogenesis GTPase Der [Alkalilimnicola ehrlichii]RFA30487.1 ribosome biogenesis GTPase Der [Alkalilimnicola ehrlichii]RFA38038.1 ribosome biogenesis GTPase Der [Alkalilimnicola ehrlichii]
MEPVIVLVGRPNVGKSTLFNYLTRSRDALVADYPGLTRDRQYGRGKVGSRPYIVVDTGGLGDDPEGVALGMQSQAMRALDEADVVLFLVDARAGLTAADEELATVLRRRGTPLYLVVNKVDGMNRAMAGAEFHRLGLGEPHMIAASQGTHVAPFIEQVLTDLAPQESGPEGLPAELEEGIKVAVVGRPNVGKSTLVNRMLGEERVLVYDMPGTTRDSIFIPFERDDCQYTLIDTAGVRRRARIDEAVEKFSVVKTLQAIEAANVVIMVVDAHEAVTDQDASLAGHVLESGRALVLAVNKWDGLQPAQKESVRRQLDVKLGFLDFARTHYISALHGSGVGLLFDDIRKAYDAAMRKLSTPLLNEVLSDAVAAHEPPLVHGRRIKLRYAHQGGQNPPLIVIHGNQTEKVPAGYRRYLINVFRRELGLQGTPVRIEFKTGQNPYEGRQNKLTPRQLARRRRLMRFVKRKG